MLRKYVSVRPGIWASLIVLPALLAGGCQKKEEATGTTASGANAAAGGKTVLIGEYGSLTGSEATFGQSTHNGLILALKEQNAAGGVKGHQVTLRTYDDQGKTQEAGTAVTRLVTQDKVLAIIGEVASSLSLAGGAVAQQYGVPMISPSSTNPRVTEGRDMVSRVCFIDPFQGYVVARFAREHLKISKVGTLYDQGAAYSMGLKDDFKKTFKELGGNLTSEQAYNSGDQDFSAQLGTLRGAGVEAIFVPGYYTDVGNIAIQARKMGLKVPLLGGDGWDSAKLAEIAGEAIEGSYYSNHYSDEEERPEVKDFVRKYKEAFGQVPDGLAALGYDAGKLLFQAMARAPSWNGKDLAKAIAETKDFHGVTGVISIDGNRNAQKPAVMLVMKGGRPRYLTTIQPPAS